MSTKPRVSNERLETVLVYCDSHERQGYPVPLSEFKAIVQAAIDARAELARLRPVVEAAKAWRATWLGADPAELRAADDSRDALIAAVDALEAGK